MPPCVAALALLATALPADRELLRAETRSAADQAIEHYNLAEFDRALASAEQAVELARRLKARDPVALLARMRLGDALYGVDRLDEAEAAYTWVVERTERQRTEDDVLLLVEATSNLGATHHAKGDLITAREWHETSWALLQRHQVFRPIRFVVASQFAQTAIAQADFATARTLEEWVVASLVNEVGPDDPAVADAQMNLATLLAHMGDAEGAIATLQGALAVQKAADPGSLKVAAAQMQLADVYIGLSRTAEAKETLDLSYTALVERFGEGDPRLEGVISSQAALAILSGRYEEALALELRVLELRTKSAGSAHFSVADQQGRVATVLTHLGRLDEAEALQREAIAVLEANHGASHPKVALLRAEQARTVSEQGRYDEAVALLEGAVAALEGSPVAVAHASTLWSNLGHAQHLAGRHRDAEASHRVAIERAEQHNGPEHPVAARALNAYAALLLDEGRLDEAELRFRRSVALLERAQGPNHPDLTGPLNNLALTLQEMGNVLEAQPLYERVLQITRDVYGEGHLQLGAPMHNLGLLLVNRGDDAGARRWLERAVAVKEAALGPEHPDLAVTLSVLAEVELAEENEVEAEALMRRALRLRETLGASHPDVAYSLDQLARFLVNEGRLDEARLASRRALDIAEGALGPDAARPVGPHSTLAALLRQEGDLTASRDAYRTILENLPPAMGPTQAVRLSLRGEIAVLTGLLGDEAAAREELQEVLDLEAESLQELIGTLSERERLSLARAHRSTLFHFLDLQGTATGDPDAAYRAVLRFKGIGSRSLAVEQPAMLAMADPQTYARWREVRATLSSLALSGEAGVSERMGALTETQEVLRRTLAAAASKDRASLEQIGPEALCKALPAGSALVDVVRRSARSGGPGDSVAHPTVPVEWRAVYTAFVLTSGCTNVARVELGDAEQIDADIHRHRALLASRAPTARVDRQGERVRRSIWDPIAGFTEGAEHILFVPDGAIATASLAALPLDDGYLLEQRSFRSLDSAFDARPRGGGPPSTGAVVVGGVDYGGSPGAGDGTRAACVSGFPALPDTAAEADDVAQRWGPHGAVALLTGREATEEALSTAVAGASLIHLATHGFFATGACRSALALDGPDAVVGLDPMSLSGVALAGANEDVASIWTAEEIATLPLGGVDLVVLSACETGLGEIEDGEGVLGLRRAFALSGARATVMSLWPVEDAATRALMAAFYEALLADPARDEQQALRAAQRQLLAENLARTGEARPDTWGAFIVSGSPR